MEPDTLTETEEPKPDEERNDGNGPSNSLDIPYTDSGVATILVALVGPRESGKTVTASILIQMLSPKERLICAGPVPTMAERLGVPWYKVSRLDRKGADAFFTGLERSDAHFFLALDEADSFLGASQYYSQPLQEWVRDNRNFGQGGLFIGHSIGEVAKSYLNNCDLIFFFRQSTPGTREWLKKYASDEMEDIDEVVATLPKYTALVWAPNSNPKCLGIAKADLESKTIRIVPIEELRERPKEEPDPETSIPRTAPESAVVDTVGPSSAAVGGTTGASRPIATSISGTTSTK